MSDKLEVGQYPAETPGEDKTKEALDLMKKGVAGGIVDTLKSFKNLPPDDKKALVGGAIALVGYLLLAAQKGEEKKESETGSKTSVPPESETKAELKQARQELSAEGSMGRKPDSAKATPAIVPVPAPKKEIVSRPETIKQNDVFYVGDSYMDGVTTGRGISADNMDAVTSRPFISTGKHWEGNDVLTKAKMTLDNPRCKTLVINGGLNDFYNSGNPEAAYNRLVKGYGDIINIARSKGVKVVILDVPVIPKDHSKKAGVIDYTNRLNAWFRKQSGVKVVDTGTALAGIFAKDKTHATGRGYKKIYEKAQEAMV
jgi:hypothetical protein